MAKETGLYLESTPDERFGVLPGEERLVKDIMRRNAPGIEVSRSLKEAADMMRRHDAPALIALRDRRLAGILTEHDIVTRGMTVDAPPSAISVQHVLGDGEPIACRDQAILAEAARLMADQRLESIPVVDADGAVVGLLTLSDIVGAVMPNAAATWLARVRRDRGSPELGEGSMTVPLTHPKEAS